MENAELLTQLRSAPSERRAHWHRAMRLLMSLQRNERGVDWSSADLEVDDSPVSTDEWQSWLRTEPEHVTLMVSMLELEVVREGIPTFEQVLDFVLDEVPSLAAKFLVMHPSAVRREIENRAGAKLGRASGGKGAVSWAEHGRDELVGAWLTERLRDPKAHLNANTFKQLNRREDISGALRAVYPALTQRIIKGIRKGNPGDIDFRSDWLGDGADDLDESDKSSTETLDEILKTQRTKPANLDRALALLVEQGTSHGLEAIAGLLSDKKAGDAALFWLACAGHAGLRAARTRWSGTKGAKAKKAGALIDTLASLPLQNPNAGTPLCLLASDMSAWELTETTSEASDVEPALSREEALRMCAGAGAPPAKREDLSPEAWADYLVLSSMDDHLTDPGPTWDRAREAGWLGQGSSKNSLTAAARRLNPHGRTHWHSASNIGWGHLFLWAGAERDVYVSALCLCLRASVLRRTLGWIETHWLTPLKDTEVPWASEVDDWLDRVQQGSVLVGAIRERPTGESVEWDSARDSMHAEIAPNKTALFSFGKQSVTLEPHTGTMTLAGPLEGQRRFPPTARPLPVAWTLTSDGMQFSLGSVMWGVFPVPETQAKAEGVTSIVLRHQARPEWPALGRIVNEDQKGAASLLALKNEEAARLLFLVATLRPALLTDAVQAALAALGDLAAPYRAELGLDAEPPSLPSRTFEEVVESLTSFTKRPTEEQNGWEWSTGHAQRRGGFVGPAVYLLEGAEAPEANELQRLASECPLYPEGETSQLQMRDTLGVREASWILVPEDGGFGNGPLFYQIHAACWPVQEGCAVAVWSGFDVPSIHWLIGVPFLPSAPWNPA